MAVIQTSVMVWKDRTGGTPNMSFCHWSVGVTGYGLGEGGDEEIVRWALHDDHQGRPIIGGLFPTMETALRDKRLWHEAPIYGNFYGTLLMATAVKNAAGVDLYRKPVLVHLTGEPYGHIKYDHMQIMLFANGRLMYPSWLCQQYEPVACAPQRHNKVVVDKRPNSNEGKSRQRYDFSSEVKFLTNTCTGLNAGVTEVRSLFVTDEYVAVTSNPCCCRICSKGSSCRCVP